MSKIQIECFDDMAEISSISTEESKFLTLKFNTGYNGYISLGRITVRIVGEECCIDASGLDDGVYSPKLILCDRSINLPPIRKEKGLISPVDYDIGYLRELSIRERRLSQRVESLSQKIEQINEKVFGSSIFRS